MTATRLAISLLCLLALPFGCHTVSLDSEPSGAKVYVDGQYWGTTPCTHTWMLGQKMGGFTASMVLPGYDNSECPLMQRGRAMHSQESLLTSAPGGAQVYVDNVYVGNSPLFRLLFFPNNIRAVWTKEVLAKSKYRQEAAPAQPPVVRHEGPGPVRNRFALVVGLSDYKYRGKWNLANLRYAADDAKAFADYLKSEKGGRFDQVILLTDKQATTKNIKAALRESLRGVQKDDLVVIFWSGHGGPDPYDPKSLYLVTYDTDPEHMASTAYAMDEFKTDVGRLAAQRMLILADTCHSAGISDPRQGVKGPSDNKIVEGIKGVYVAPDKPGDAGPMWMIFTSCEAGEVSREYADLGGGHGVFTYYLLRGLKGEADRPKNGGNGDGKVTVGECIEFTRDQVKRYTRNRQHPDTAGRFDRNLTIGGAE